MKKIKILIADDHSVVRSGLRLLFQRTPEFSIVGEAADGEEVIRLANEQKPDVAIVDISMPKLNGIEATRIIKEQNPAVKVLILTVHENEGYIYQMMRAGANGYVLKNAEKKEIFDAIHTLVSGGQFFSSPSVSKLLIDGFVRRAKDQEREPAHPPGTRPQLTNRETEILGYIAQSLTSREIADKLDLSVRTVNTHRANLMQKLNIHDTAGLVRFAIQNGIVDLTI